MKAKPKEIRKYLIKEQGYDEEVVNAMDNKELTELWNYYHEDL